MGVNPVLFSLAQLQVWKQAAAARRAELEKQANPAMDPNMAAMAGMPAGMDPNMAAMAGMAAGMPAGAPMDPNMAAMAGLPAGAPMDPSMAAMAAGMLPPNMAVAVPPPPPPSSSTSRQRNKIDATMLDYRLYNIQQQLTALLNALQIPLPPGAVVLPPGTQGVPPVEAALPGGPMDPAAQAQAQPPAQAGGDQSESAIQPIQPMPAAFPETTKQGAEARVEQVAAALAHAMWPRPPATVAHETPYGTAAAALSAIIKARAAKEAGGAR